MKKKKEITKLPFDPTKEVRADYWPKLSLQQLWEQHILLQRRLEYANRLQNYNMAQGLQRGITVLKEYIDKAYNTEERDPRSPLLY